MENIKSTILVVDDEGIIALDLQQKLRRLGYAVPTLAHSAEQAIEKVAEVKPDLVLMDINMGGVMDGIDAALWLHDHTGPPVVFLTAYGNNDTIQRAKLAEPYGYIVKPFTETELRIAIEIALHKSHTTSLLRQHAKQQATLAEFSQRALRETRVDALMNALMDDAVARIAATLCLDCCYILEWLPNEQDFLLRAGAGWQAGAVGQVLMQSDLEASEIGFTLKSAPLIIADLATETRFASSPLLREHNIISGANVIIHGSTKLLGVLGVYNRLRHDFTADQVNFLQAMANVISQAIERKQIEEALRVSEERYALAACGSNDGLWDWNLKTDEVYYSDRWKTMLGYAATANIGTSAAWLEQVHPDDVELVRAAIKLHLEDTNAHLEIEYRMQHQDGDYRWMLCRGIAVRDAAGVPYRMAGSQTDITERKLAEAQLLRNAFFDTLTTLPNRALFVDRLGNAIARAKRHQDFLFAVLFLDLDRFKVINDSLGHTQGDQLLIEVAQRLNSCVRPGDTTARLGGDEFTLLLEDIEDISDATRVAQRIQHELSLPFGLHGQEVFTSVSVGIALSATDYDQPGDLLRDADIAMYRAKAQGRSRYAIFDAAMHEKALAQLQLENDLRRALERNEFCVYYQPIVALKSGQLAGFEALVRWNHPERGLVSPATFIPAAEETGLIVPLGRWIFREACRQMHAWHQQFAMQQPLSISINVSACQFAQSDLVAVVEALLRETQFDPRHLKLEITESVLMDNLESATAKLLQLRGLDIQLYLDDFGTGYSSLSYLHQFPINTLKIDRCFVSQMTEIQDNGQGNWEIVETIITLAHNLDIRVTAEGIETAAQLAYLRSLECEYGQGYYLATPLDSQSAAALIATNPHW